MIQSKRGFTLIELLIVVVIIGVLAAIAIPKFANTKEKATLASMKTDLRNLATAEEGFYYDYSTYASATATSQSSTETAFQPSGDNVVTISNASLTGWAATMTNPSLKGSIQTCGIFMGAATSPNAAVTQEGAPACY
ncbi:MAG TPA: prepilin-type N-terminal cleavage/methylation domain-containing protein [Gemmatimonadales bacterium]|nr:prepilin-type N-terminal cleavage/methylation domain-containing protein [Gemmatimonadales bacterium]